MITVGELRSMLWPLNNANDTLHEILNEHVPFADEDDLSPSELVRVENLQTRLSAMASDLRMHIDGTYLEQPSQPKEPK